jgi:L-asparagine transporter-like permease
MMALAGIIGPGLLVGAGGALNVGGPAALLIGFGVVGMMFIVLRSLKSIWDQEVLFSLQILTKFNANSWQVSSPSVLCSPLAR